MMAVCAALFLLPLFLRFSLTLDEASISSSTLSCSVIRSVWYLSAA